MKLVCLFLLWSLCGAGASTAPPFLTQARPTEARSRFAMLDDVRLLANGLLQLGQSLREFVHKTKSQINDIFQKLNIFDRSFYRLSVVTSEIKEEEEELKKTTSFLRVNNEEIKNLSLEINSKINGILRERAQLHSKVGNLEEKLQGLSQSMMPPEQVQEIDALKEMIDTQDKTIKELLRSVREQHEQLDFQRVKIKSLEDKLNNDPVQETAEKMPDSILEEPKVLGYQTSNSSTMDLPVDCDAAYAGGLRTSGVHLIKPDQSEPFYTYCEIRSGGGATVIQRRVDGSVDFDQTWERYERGFGTLEHEFWLGLEKIYSITRQGNYTLNIELEDWREEKHHMEYALALGGPGSRYTAHFTYLSGDLPDAMGNHTGMMFSTKDNSNLEDSSCALNHTGGWWFNACGGLNLNGRYAWMRSRNRRKGIYWRPSRGGAYTLRFTKMALAPSSSS